MLAAGLEHRDSSPAVAMAAAAAEQTEAARRYLGLLDTATATGLAIAIGSLVPHNYFAARTERLLDEIERTGSRLEVVLAEERA